MTHKKRLILNLFEMNCVSHITHGLWRLPGNNRERFNGRLPRQRWHLSGQQGLRSRIQL
jgi:hypothetical protein